MAGRLRTDYEPIAAELAERDADAFVHVGDRFDDDLRYLTRFSGPDRAYAFVYREDEAFLPAPALFAEQAERDFPGTVLPAGDGPRKTASERAADLLEPDSTVLVPAHVPHETAVRLERAGHDLASTTVVDGMRAVKSDAEIDRLRAVQTATVEGMRRAETVLAEAVVEGDGVRWAGETLTTERLRREVNATFAAEGLTDAGNTVIGAGPSCADLHFTGNDTIVPGETVLLDLSPRGPDGYYGDCSRTFVVESEGGWERRAHVAVERAQDAAFDALSSGAGTPANEVHREAAAEIGAYGFSPTGEPGFTHGIGHGVGVSLHEAPSMRSSEPLEPGMVLTVEPGVYDGTIGGVRIEDLVLVTEDGYELLGEYHRSLVPRLE
ncbi:M24 family metallopeptidase [Natronorarus salvus]|uniref:M24 family metallopeptidase n=1 Tax=Natronorarus salvus TaxID=3117733 RepID=UPI002F2617FB